MVRRVHRAARLRQKHARLPDRDGTIESTGADGLRRHDSSRKTGRPKSWISFPLFNAYGEYLAGTIDDETRQQIVRKSCPGAGACGGMYTANTMASAIEALGMSLPYSASIPAEDPDKIEECHRAGGRDLELAGDGYQAARHHDARSVRKCDGGHHGTGRIDQRRAAPDRDGSLRRRAADDR